MDLAAVLCHEDTMASFGLKTPERPLWQFRKPGIRAHNRLGAGRVAAKRWLEYLSQTCDGMIDFSQPTVRKFDEEELLDGESRVCKLL